MPLPRHEKPIVGFAKTATMRAKNPARWGPAEYMDIRAGYFDYLARARHRRSAWCRTPTSGRATVHYGEVFSAVHKALGCRGVVTNGSVRDIDMLAPDFQVLAGLIAPSHAFVHVAQWGCEVNVHGMVVQDGDLIHADRHGAVVVPLEAVRGVLGKLDLMVRREAVILEAARRPDATVGMIKDAWQRSTEIKE